MNDSSCPRFEDSDLICYCTLVTKKDLVSRLSRVKSPEELKVDTGASRVCMGCEMDVDFLIEQNKSMLGREAPPERKRGAQAADLEPAPSWQRQTSWVVEEERLHSRLVMANLRIPTLSSDNWEMPFKLTLYDPAGREVARKEDYVLPKDRVISIEMGPLVREALGGGDYHGIAQVDGWQPCLGSTRFWIQWYNQNGLTTTHERFDNAINHARKFDHFFACTSAVVTSTQDTFYAFSNLHVKPFRSRIVLRNIDGQEQSTEIEVPPNGSLFRGAKESFRDPVGFLKGRPGVLYFEERTLCAMIYYFIYDENRGLWQGQHT